MTVLTASPVPDVDLSLPNFIGTLTELLHLVRAREIPVSAIDIVALARQILEQAPAFDLYHAGNAVLCGATVVEERTRQWLAQLRGEVVDELRTPEDEEERLRKLAEIELERSIVKELVRVAGEAETKMFPAATTAEDASPWTLIIEKPRDSGVGESLNEAARNLIAASKAIADVEWYTDEEMRAEILRRVRDGPISFLECFRDGEPRRTRAAFLSVLELCRSRVLELPDGAGCIYDYAQIVARQLDHDLIIGRPGDELPEEIQHPGLLASLPPNTKCYLPKTERQPEQLELDVMELGAKVKALDRRLQQLLLAYPKPGAEGSAP